MDFRTTRLQDAFLVFPEPSEDQRGFFARTFCQQEFAGHGLQTAFVQHSRSLSRTRGTLRGLHFQAEPHSEVKVVTCIAGAIYDVIVDLRTQSPTYLHWQGFELTARSLASLYVPKGFAHGFQTLTADAQVHYLISEFYQPAAARGLRYDDPALAIDWPEAVSEISHRDLCWPYLAPTLTQSSGVTGASSPQA